MTNNLAFGLLTGGRAVVARVDLPVVEAFVSSRPRPIRRARTGA